MDLDIRGFTCTTPELMGCVSEILVSSSRQHSSQTRLSGVAMWYRRAWLLECRLEDPSAETSAAGTGISAQHRLNRLFSVFGDGRLVVPVGSQDRDGLEIRRRPVFDATGGLNFRAWTNTTLTAQLNLAGSPYARTGLPAFDNRYSDVTFGLRHQFSSRMTLAFYSAEDFNTAKKSPGQDFMTPYGPADFKIGAELIRGF